MRFGFIGVFILAAGGCAAQQIVTYSFRTGGPAWGTGTFQLSPMAERSPARARAPYSAEERHTAERILDDGQHVPSFAIPGEVKFRDRDGRTRVERLVGANLRWVEIADPLAAVIYILDPQRKAAYRLRYRPLVPSDLPPTDFGPGKTIKHKLPNGTEITQTDLGTKYFGPFLARGTRQTEVLHETRNGKHLSATNTNETWIAPMLGGIVYQHSVRQDQESTTELVNLSNANPSPSLFLPPADYMVEDRTFPLTVEIGIRPEGEAPLRPPVPSPFER